MMAVDNAGRNNSADLVGSQVGWLARESLMIAELF
jgi:hypothetical protein